MPRAFEGDIRWWRCRQTAALAKRQLSFVPVLQGAISIQENTRRPAGMFHKERAKSLTEDSTNKIINKNDSSCKTPDFWKKLW